MKNFQLKLDDRQLAALRAATGQRTVPFFLVNQPCLATGRRRKKMEPLELELSGYCIGPGPIPGHRAWCTTEAFAGIASRETSTIPVHTNAAASSSGARRPGFAKIHHRPARRNLARQTWSMTLRRPPVKNNPELQAIKDRPIRSRRDLCLHVGKRLGPFIRNYFEEREKAISERNRAHFRERKGSRFADRPRFSRIISSGSYNSYK